MTYLLHGMFVKLFHTCGKYLSYECGFDMKKRQTLFSLQTIASDWIA